jgi:hypothetical protein
MPQAHVNVRQGPSPDPRRSSHTPFVNHAPQGVPAPAALDWRRSGWPSRRQRRRSYRRIDRTSACCPPRPGARSTVQPTVSRHNVASKASRWRDRRTRRVDSETLLDLDLGTRKSRALCLGPLRAAWASQSPAVVARDGQMRPLWPARPSPSRWLVTELRGATSLISLVARVRYSEGSGSKAHPT